MNLSSVCQRCCTKEKVPEEKAPANSCCFFVWTVQTKNTRVWSCGCSLGVPAGILPSLLLQIQYCLGSAKFILTLPTMMCSFTHLWHFQTSIFVLALGYLLWLRGLPVNSSKVAFARLLGFFFFKASLRVCFIVMFTRKLDILTAGAGNTSYDIEQYYVFVSLLFSCLCLSFHCFLYV